MSDGEHADHADGRLLAGRYRLLSVVGSGGMGTVWRARDEVLDREVAVKEVFLHASLDADERENRLRRTLREARASARLNHPGVVTVHDVVDEDGRPWIVMELVNARSLQGVLDEEGPLPPGRVAAIGRQVVGALRAAHAIGILHRDVKPANVLVADDDRAVLTDFGIAQMAGDATLTHTGLIMGSPAYMSPERLKGEPAIPASDLWALGATLYAACEGRAPHHRSDAMAVLAAVMTLDAPPPRNAGPLASVLLALLERDPVQRMSADRAEEALAAVASGHAASEAAEQIARQARDLATVADRPWPADTAVDGDAVNEPVSHHGASQAPHAPVPVPMPDMTLRYPEAGGPSDGHPDGHPHGHWTPGDPGTVADPPTRRRRVLPVVLGALGAVALLVPVVVFLSPLDASSGDREATPPPAAQQSSGAPSGVSPSASPSASPRTPVPREASLPVGLTPVAGPGYTIGVPRGWRRSEQGNSTVWLDPGSSAYVQVDRTPWTGDPYEHWVTWEREAIADGKLENFNRISITRTNVGSLPAADIEFEWSRQGGTRARDRGVIVNGTPYAVVVAVPTSKWNENEALVKNVLDTFRPSGVG